MAHRTKVSGTAYEITGGRTKVNGTGYSIAGGKTKVGGTAYDISFFNGLFLGDIPVGSIVYINESGTAVPFYVACHNYESGLNGNGKTLLVRQKCHSSMRWGFNSGWADPSYHNNYAPYWFENTYINYLSSEIKSLLGTTIYSTDKIWTQLTTTTAKVFTPSLYEYGLTYVDMFKEGSTLPIASTLRVAYYNTQKVDHWTRTGKMVDGDEGEQDHGFIRTNGTAACVDVTGGGGNYYVRPCFTLPATTIFDSKTMQFVSA